MTHAHLARLLRDHAEELTSPSVEQSALVTAALLGALAGRIESGATYVRG